MSPLAFGLALIVLAQAPSNPDFKRAESLAAEYKYADARVALQKARYTKGLDRPTLLAIMELTGIVYAQLKQADKAQAAFRELLVLDPDHKLQGDFAPKVMQPFTEAQKQVKESGGLELDSAVATADGKIDTLTVKVKKDPLGLGEQLRFHVQGANGNWRAVTLPLSDYQAVLPLGGYEATWWAELLGANDVQLMLVGSESAPKVERLKPPEAAKPAEVAAAPETKIIRVGQSQGPLRPISYVLLGSALAAAGGGLYMGIRSNEAFSKIDKAAHDDQGRVTGLSEREAYQLAQQGQEQATIANVLFISAGALAATGIVLWIVGMPHDTEIALVPGPGGVVFAGTFQ
jgi:hypothetical protein